jgi:acid phosphatase
MPDEGAKVAVDGRPRLSGVMDSINATDAHGPATKLPKEFYDERLRAIIDKIGVEEWYSGYQESREYRALGIGGLLGDVVSRMVGSAERTAADGGFEVVKKGEVPQIKFGMSGCHDTTLAGALTSLGAFEGEKWPPFTSHIAIELFKQKTASDQPIAAATAPPAPVPAARSWLSKIWGGDGGASGKVGVPPAGIGRKTTEELSEAEKRTLAGYFVRIRYNDRVMTVPGCKAPGNHLEGDESFCTLVSLPLFFPSSLSGLRRFSDIRWDSIGGFQVDRRQVHTEGLEAGVSLQQRCSRLPIQAGAGWILNRLRIRL